MTRRLYRVRVSSDVAALIRSLHPQLKRKVNASLRRILEDPAGGKALHAELHGLWSYRVSRFRVIYRIKKGPRVIELVAIGPREKIYEETLRLLRREQPS